MNKKRHRFPGTAANVSARTPIVVEVQREFPLCRAMQEFAVRYCNGRGTANDYKLKITSDPGCIMAERHSKTKRGQPVEAKKAVTADSRSGRASATTMDGANAVTLMDDLRGYQLELEVQNRELRAAHLRRTVEVGRHLSRPHYNNNYWAVRQASSWPWLHGEQ